MFVRLAPDMPLPRYTYIPETDTPHPYTDRKGHSRNKRHVTPRGLTEALWTVHGHYLHSLDLLNLGFYWESWHGLSAIRKMTPQGAERQLLQGLIAISLAGVAVRQERQATPQRQAFIAAELFADLALSRSRVCGLSVEELQFMADRVARLVYLKGLQIGKPLRVFPNLVIPLHVPE